MGWTTTTTTNATEAAVVECLDAIDERGCDDGDEENEDEQHGGSIARRRDWRI
jgi:hypothetical protein